MVRLIGERSLRLINTSQQLAITLDAAGLPAMVYRELASSNKPITWPAQNPPKWYIQLDRQSLIGSTLESLMRMPKKHWWFFP